MDTFMHPNSSQLIPAKIIFLLAYYFFPFNIASANLLIIPERIILEGEQKSTSIVLINIGGIETTYQITWVQKRQMPNGRFMVISDESHIVESASRLLRFSPHKMTLSPNEKQIIRIVRKGKLTLKLGELRSHLTFQEIPEIENNDYPFNIGPPKVNRLLWRYSIPVTIQKGKLDASAKISSIILRKTVEAMGRIAYNAKLILNGAGVNTAVGALTVYWRPKTSTNYRVIGNLNNVILYPESAVVQFHVTLNIQNPSTGYMKVVYEGENEFKGKTFDTLEIPVQINDYKFETSNLK